MEKNVELFRRIWNEQYSYISMELDYADIVNFLNDQCGESDADCDVERAVNYAVDYQLSNGIGEVQE